MFTSPNVLAMIATLLCILVNASPIPVPVFGSGSGSEILTVAAGGVEAGHGLGGSVGHGVGFGPMSSRDKGENEAGKGGSGMFATTNSIGSDFVATLAPSTSDDDANTNDIHITNLATFDASINVDAIVASPALVPMSQAGHPSTLVAPIAHVNETYCFTLTPFLLGANAQNTSGPRAGDLDSTGWSYVATGLPGWMNLDGTSGELSGMPVIDGGKKECQVTGTIVASPPTGNGTITTGVDFLVVSSPSLTVINPLTSQLTNATDNNRSSSHAIISSATVLPIDANGLPGVSVLAGWSFSVGLLSPWSASSGKTFFNAVDASTGGPLPSWLTFKNTTLVFEGVAPTSVSQLGTFDIALVGSNNWGRPDSSQVFSLIIAGKHELHIPASGLELDWIIGQDLNVTRNSGPGKAWWNGPSVIEQLSAAGNWTLDGRAVKEADVAAFVVDTSGVQGNWLTSDNATRTLGGVPPALALGTTLKLPVNITDKYGDTARTTLSIAFEQAAFNTSIIAPLAVSANGSVSTELTPYFASVGNATDYNVTVSFVPRNASTWLSWNVSNLTLTGTPPASLNYSVVSVGYHASLISSAAVSHAWMNISLPHEDLVDEPKTPENSNDSPRGALGHTGHIVFAIAGSLLGAICLLYALFWYCGKYVEQEKHVVLENGYDSRHRDSDATDEFYDDKSYVDLGGEKEPGWFKDPAAVGAAKGLGFHFDKAEMGPIASPQTAVLPYAPGNGVRSASSSWRKQIARAAKRPTRLVISKPAPYVQGNGMDYIARASAPSAEQGTPAGLLASVFSPGLPAEDHPTPSPTSTIHPPIKPWADTPRSPNDNGSDVGPCPGTDFSDDSMFADTSRASWQTGSTPEKLRSRDRDRAAMLASRHGRPDTGSDSIGGSSLHSPWVQDMTTPQMHAVTAQNAIATQRYMPSGATFGTFSSAGDEVGSIGSVRTADRFNVTHEMGFEASVASALDSFAEAEGPVMYNLRAPIAHAGPGVLHPATRNRFVSDTVALSQAGTGSSTSHSRSMPSMQHADEGSIIYENDDVLAELDTFVAYQSRRASGHSAASSSAIRDATDETPTMHYTPTFGQSPVHSRKSSRRGAASPLSSDTRSIVGTATPTLVQVGDMHHFGDEPEY